MTVSETYSCPETHSKCANHFCIPNEAVCNYEDDCGDNSDEESCGRLQFAYNHNVLKAMLKICVVSDYYYLSFTDGGFCF